METIPIEVAESIKKSGWVLGKKLGEGGGGTVFRCVNAKLLDDLITFASEANKISVSGRKELVASQVVESLHSALVLGSAGLAAIKIPHKVNDAVALKRLAHEIRAMDSVKHPHLIRLFDYDKQEPPRWFAMEYHPLGSLGDEKHLGTYKGRILDALLVIRPIIDGVSYLHRQTPAYIHRDIKPHNIFITINGGLILGDFGIIFTRGDDRTRLTKPGEVIESRDWVPDWVRHRDIEDFIPKVDAHMLAKVLYFMVTGGMNVMSSQLDNPHFKLATILPSIDKREVELVDRLLHQCVTNSAEEQNIENATQLLISVDGLISELTYRRPPTLVFNIFYNDPDSYIKIPLASKVQSTTLTGRIFLPDACKEIICRARVGLLPENTMLWLEIQLENGPRGGVEITGQGLALGGHVWTDQFSLTPTKLLTEGWYEFKLQAASPSRADICLSALSIYAR